jgi:hypothetical protein
MARQPPVGQGPPHYRGFTITLRHTTFGRTPLDEGSARRRELCLTTHNKFLCFSDRASWCKSIFMTNLMHLVFLFCNMYITLSPQHVSSTTALIIRRSQFYYAHNSFNRQTSIFPAGFEPAIPANQRPQNHTFDRVATGTGELRHSSTHFYFRH